MYRNKIYVLVVAILVGCAGSSEAEAGQKITRCKVHEKGLSAPHYKLGITYESKLKKAGPPVSVVQINLDPRYLNHDDLVRLALRLKREFCREEQLLVSLYANSIYIKYIFVPGDFLYYRAEDQIRGYYYLNRKTGEEYVSYCLVPNYEKNPDKRIRIDLGTATPQNPQVQN